MSERLELHGLLTVLSWSLYDDATVTEPYGATAWLHQEGYMGSEDGTRLLDTKIATVPAPVVELSARTRLGRRWLILRGTRAARRSMRHLDHPLVIR